MSTRAVTEHAPSRATGSYGISILLHSAIATAIFLYVFATQNTRDELTQTTFSLFPDTPPAPAENTPPRIEPLAIKPTTTTPPSAETSLGPRITAEQFFSRHGRHANPVNTAPQSKPPANTAPIVAPQISTSPFANNTIGPAHNTHTSPANATAQNQMDAYFATLAQRIRQAQEKPEGLSSDLVVRIEFLVHADGAIGAAKVITSSGNTAFDNSVLQAIRTIRPIGRRPDGLSTAKTADFRMREENPD